MQELDWHEQVKRLLKAELVRRGISNDELVRLLQNIGVEETKASVDSKISRGTFSAAFLLQSMNAIGCKNLVTEIEWTSILEEPKFNYGTNKNEKNSVK